MRADARSALHLQVLLRRLGWRFLEQKGALPPPLLIAERGAEKVAYDDKQHVQYGDDRI